MKKRIMLLFCMLSVCMPMNVFANSRTTNGLTETEKLGITAGAALACGVDREQLLNYEMIASRVIANPISSVEVEKKAMQEYATAKLKAFKEQKKQSLSTCPEILERFENQEKEKRLAMKGLQVFRLVAGVGFEPHGLRVMSSSNET